MLELKKVPNTYSFDGAVFVAHSKEISKNTELLENLREKAEKLLTAKRISVVDRRIRAASGDIHDYASMGPYWWPNPNTENGLPYIRKDGQHNPETKDSGWGDLFDSILYLTLAAYYLEEPKYAEKAIDNIRIWYLDPETKCNPHLNYAQSIPGICDGRGIGLIDTNGSHQLFESVAILDAMGYMPGDVITGLKAWYTDFLNWMLTSEIGVDEERQPNNHGAWYDVQVAVTALFLDRPILAERTLTLAYERRILKHIDAEGKQPHELARTNAIGYSTMNLHALMKIANLAKKAKCKKDMWHEKREDGSYALKAAIDYLSQFADGLEKFPYSQLNGKPNPDGCARLMLTAAKEYPSDGYEKKAEKYLKNKQLWRLLP